jgi:hypothetical protein
MISPLQIALGGLAPGSSPITIATEGMIVTITAPKEQEDAQWIPLRSFGPPDATPYDSRKKRTKRIDAVVNVEGVSGTLTCTPANVFELAREARLVPIFADYCLKYFRWKKSCRQKSEPATAAARAQIAAKTKAARREKRQLRAEADRFVAEIGLEDHPNAGRLLHAIILENQRLQNLLEKKSS